MKKDFVNNLLKTIIVFLCYFLYSNVISSVLTSVGISNTILISFFADLIFLLGIVFVYKDILSSGLNDIKKNYEFKNILKKVFFWVIIIFVFNIIMGVITDIIWPNNVLDNNTKAVRSIENVFYVIFKTMIFSVIAEELVYRTSIRQILSSKTIFIILSAAIYALMNFIFIGFESKFLVVDILSYFLPALIFSYAYTKNNDNIILLMLIKFVYQLIPLTLLLLSV